jgi:ribosomal protein L22
LARSRVLADLVGYDIRALAKDIDTPTVIEFGSASGLPSLLLATCVELVAQRCHPIRTGLHRQRDAPRLVTLTDHPAVVATARTNAASASALARSAVHVLPHTWGEPVASLLAANAGARYDLALLSDLLYLDSVAPELVASLARVLARPHGRARIYSGTYTPAAVIARFEALLAAEGLVWRELALDDGWRGTTAIEGVVWVDEGEVLDDQAIRKGMTERKAQVRGWEATWKATP